MPVTTVSAATHITPVVIRTFFSHGKRKAKKIKDSKAEEEATDDIFFDEAFHIVKAFIDLGTKNTVESLQEFTNTYVPAPPWAAVSFTRVPLSSCNDAADILIDWFGPVELKRVVGGERWWQVRGLDGIDAEWITQKDFLSDKTPKHELGRKLTGDEERLLRMEELETVILYVHGGGYFWGSINTHRYQLIRYARKCKGRVFAVNYRKAPQYPWPCPLHDAIAAYLYLIRPPKGALHKPVSPAKIVFAGDSAGGGVCVSALTVLRDMDVPLPAGAVLISPWVDLTHSFPSVMENTKTDIIPEHGFLAKPSTLWPVDPVPPSNGRIGPTQSKPPPEPGHADTLHPSKTRVEEDEQESGHEQGIETQEEMLQEHAPTGSTGAPPPSSDAKGDENEYDIDTWEPRPPKVLMKDPEAVPLELRSQIQLYATNEQLTHPLVSPILQSTLGGLPPLYILAGDGEVLRDEIMYFAHRAAYPQEFPTRKGVLRDGRRQEENVKRFDTPTKVHLQVYDGMCHVLPVFTFTPSAKHAYRAVAAFVKHVTNFPNQLPERNPFPELLDTMNDSSSEESDDDEGQPPKKAKNDAQPSSSTVSSASKTPTDSGNLFIRERVDIRGRVRPMESKEETKVLRVKPGEVGLIKEAPAIRWNQGQEKWDKKFRRRAEKIVKKRAAIETKTERMLANAKLQGLLLRDEQGPTTRETVLEDSESATESGERHGMIQSDRRWGPLDLDEEDPPPSAIAKRRDTNEAYALLRKHIYHTAPVTHRYIPKLKPSDALRAAFDPHDDPLRAPQQSVSEQQVKTHIIPIHGLKMWDAILRYFMRETSKKVDAAMKDSDTPQEVRLENKSTGKSA